MNAGDLLSPLEYLTLLISQKPVLRHLRLRCFYTLALPLFFSLPLCLSLSVRGSAQSLLNVAEDENHISQDWISALRLEDDSEKKPVLCRLSAEYGLLGIWASKEGLEITAEQDSWDLVEKTGGPVTLQIHNHFKPEDINAERDPQAPVKSVPFQGRLTPDFQDTFFMMAQNKNRMAASITEERLVPLLAALEQGASATLRFGTRTPKSLSLSGAGEAIRDFRQCAYLHHFADIRPAVEEDKNPLEAPLEEAEKSADYAEEPLKKTKEIQDPLQNPFAPKSVEDPWPKPTERQQAVIDDSDDPDAPETPNEFTEQPKSPGAPPPLTAEEQAELDQKRADAVQEKERLAEMERQKQLEAEEEEEAKKRAEEREAKRLADIAAAKQAQESRRQRNLERAKARKESEKARIAREKKAKEAARRKALMEQKAPPRPEEIEARHLQTQSAQLNEEMRKAQTFMQNTAQQTKNRRRKNSAKLAAQQISSARESLGQQAHREAIEIARGSKNLQNERAENANISMSQAEGYLKAQSVNGKTAKARKTSKNLSQEMEAAQKFLQDQTLQNEKTSLGAQQKARAKNTLPFSRQEAEDARKSAKSQKARSNAKKRAVDKKPATYREDISTKPLPFSD